MMHFCTLFDRNFLARGLALERSLSMQGVPFRLWVLCLDDETKAMLDRIALESVTSITLQEVESRFPLLVEAKETRSIYEYFGTLKAHVIRYVLETNQDVDILSHLDADLYFFGDPKVIESQLGEASVLLTPHNFPEGKTQPQKHGTYNAGFITFRNDEKGRAALSWWTDRVIEWCSDHVKEGKFLDQGYLNQMAEIFNDVSIASDKGLNLAPWNVEQYQIGKVSDWVMVERDPLIFYHFHSCRPLTSWLWDGGIAPYRFAPDSALKRLVYAPYIRQLCDVSAWLQSEFGFERAIGTVRYKDRHPLTQPILAFSRIRRNQWFLCVKGRIL